MSVGPGGKVQVSGQVSVMAINGLLVKLVFDRNPERQFYVEEGFPLDWMYPYLEPDGLIMKLNREPLSTLSEESLQRDHDYWTRYLQPILGNWLNDDTSIEKVVEFADEVHLQHDFARFKADPQFIRNEYSCKMFSKLRSSQAGLFAWRLAHSTDAAEKDRLARDADFAFRQALALGPSSLEVIYRYVDFLMQQNRQSDALLVASACLKLDPKNSQLAAVVTQLKTHRVAR